MRKLQQVLVCSVFLLAFQLNSFGQVTEEDSTKVSWDWYQIVKHNGVEYVAQILSDDGREVLIYTKELGKIYIPKGDIKVMRKIDNPKDIVHGVYNGESLFSTRYFFTTNALPIKKGENYAMINFYGPEVHAAVTNSTSIGVMSTWIGSPIALALKQTFKTNNENLNFSVGTIFGTSGYFNSFRGFAGLTFGNVTVGSRNSNITFSAGLGYFQSGNKSYYDEGRTEYFDGGAPETYGSAKGPVRIANMFALSGITKVGPKASFICDVLYSYSTYVDQEVTSGVIYYSYYDANGNYIPGKYFQEVKNVKKHRPYLIIMPGMRFQKSDQHAFQFALAGVTVFGGSTGTFTFPAPMCSWFYKF